MTILESIRNLLGGPLFVFCAFLAIVLGFVIFLNICTLIRNLIINLKTKTLTKGALDPSDSCHRYFSQFKRHLESLHLTVGSSLSSAGDGILQDKVTLQIVGNYKFIDCVSSGTECGVYIYNFNSKYARLGNSEFKFVLKPLSEEKVSSPDLLVSENSKVNSVTEVSKFRIEDKNFLQLKSSDFISQISITSSSNEFLMSGQTVPNISKGNSCIETASNISHIADEMALFSGRNAKKTSHKYLHGNGIEPHKDLVIAKKFFQLLDASKAETALESNDNNIMEIHKGDLIIPIRNLKGTLISYQVINMKSKFHFRKGLSIKGGCYIVGGVVTENIHEYILCEDYATANLLNRVTGKISIACFDIQNIFEVANQIRFICPNANFIFATNRDLNSKNKVKIKKAFDYALHFNASFVFPKFPEEKRFEHFKTWVELRKYLNDEEVLKVFSEQINFFEGRSTADVVASVAARYGIP